MKPRLLDLFCGAGGAAVGYHRAGFEVVGVDIKPQPNYPFRFYRGDALDVLRRILANDDDEPGWQSDEFAAVHASPPCQAEANVTRWRGNQDDHPRLIAPTRELLIETGLPYVIENVRTKSLRNPLMLCGSQFGLPIRRHRYFETNWLDFSMASPCQHRPTDFSFDHGAKQPESVYRDAMDCGWTTVEESRQAIPPAYTEHIGGYLMTHLNVQAKAAA